MKRLFEREPDWALTTIAELLGVALAMEREAVLRYGQLADAMAGRGHADTAAVFLALVEEERDHAAAIAALADRLGHAPAPPERATWRLPPEIAASWEELVGRTRVTPYQALALAVLNEQRGFAYYSYAAAHAEDAEVRSRAEALAGEELNHAARLRRERRRAWRRERGARGHGPVQVGSLAELEALWSPLAARTVAGLHRLAGALAARGDAEGGALVAGLANSIAGPADGPPRHAGDGDATGGDLLREAAALCAELAESLEDLAAGATDESVLLAVQSRQETVVAGLNMLKEYALRPT